MVVKSLPQTVSLTRLTYSRSTCKDIFISKNNHLVFARVEKVFDGVVEGQVVSGSNHAEHCEVHLKKPRSVLSFLKEKEGR